MTEPRWDSAEVDAGVMVRGALWLIQEIREGNVFTKADIRQAFPGTAQADRRIRDLRDYGWVLHTRAEDASLLLEQTRFVSAGVAVWDRRARREATKSKGPTARERDAIMGRDGYACTVCGIAGGEEYPDDVTQTAVLSVAKQGFFSGDGRELDAWSTICGRCRSGRGTGRERFDEVVRAASDLDRNDLEQLKRWMQRRRRDRSRVELVWSQYLCLPPEAREELRASLEP